MPPHALRLYALVPGERDDAYGELVDYLMFKYLYSYAEVAHSGTRRSVLPRFRCCHREASAKRGMTTGTLPRSRWYRRPPRTAMPSRADGIGAAVSDQSLSNPGTSNCTPPFNADSCATIPGAFIAMAS